MPIAKSDRQTEAIEGLAEVVSALTKTMDELKDAVKTLSSEVEELRNDLSDFGNEVDGVRELSRTIDYLGNQLWRQNHLPLVGVNKKRG